MKIGIIGGGASGMILASKLNKYDVTIIERNSKLGKKLLLTGNGKCNFTNMNFENIKRIYNNEFAINLYNKFDNISFINYLKELGIVSKIETHKGINYVYPNSNKSSSVYYSLLDRINYNKVSVKYNSYVKDIKVKNNKFVLELDNNETLEFDKIVLATGGMSYKNTGSNGNGYALAKKLGHKIIEPVPGLVALKYCLKKYDNFNLRLNGKCRVNALVSYNSNDETICFNEYGEIQFSDDNISGIPIMNLSSKIGKNLINNGKINFAIDFSYNIINDITDDNYALYNNDKISNLNLTNKKNAIRTFLIERKKSISYRKIQDFLCGFLPDEINEVILKLSGVYNSKISNLNDREIDSIADNIIAFKIYVNKLSDFDNAQITLGGVDTSLVDNDKLESKLVKNLYFTGEILDIDGICGGYNLQLAYSTASVVADSL